METKNKDSSKKFYTAWWFWVIMAVVFLGVLGSVIPDNTDTNSKVSSSSVKVGEEGRLYLEGETLVPVCKTEYYLDKLIDAAVVNDEIGYKEMFKWWKCYMVSTLDDYGRVLVLENTWDGVTKFRFVNPDTLHYGEIGWTNYEFIISS